MNISTHNFVATGEMALVLPELLENRLDPGPLVIVEDVQLALQTLADVPISVKEILEPIWPSNYRALGLRKHSSVVGNVVLGQLFKIKPEDQEYIADEWGLAFLEWSTLQEVLARESNGQSCRANTLILSEGQKSQPDENGLWYPREPLNGRETTLAVAQRIRVNRQIS